MSKTKISDLRNEIAYLKEMLDASHVIIKDESAKVSAERARSLFLENEISLNEGMIASQNETIEAQREIIDLYKLRIGVTVQTGRSARFGEGDALKAGTARRYAVIIHEHGPQKIKVIKAIRSIVEGMTLKRAKDLSESSETEITSGSLEHCNRARDQLKEAGAVVSVQPVSVGL